MLFVESTATDPRRNLALEERLFTSLSVGESCFMLWRNEPAVIVGRFQNTEAEVDRGFVEDKGIHVVRRLSGGGAVYHDLGNLNYSFIVDAGEAAGYDFGFFARNVVDALARIGVEAACTGRNDLTIDGRKFSGSAQHVGQGRILHHGCIMLDTDLSAVAGALKPRDIKFSSKAVKSVRSRVTTVSAAAGRTIACEEFAPVLAREVFGGDAPAPCELGASDLAAVEQLFETKYARWEWNWGASPAWSLSNAMKFPAGIVEVALDVRAGRIAQARIFGDFFGTGDIGALEAALVGVAVDDALEESLAALAPERYLHGIGAVELAQVIRG